MEIYRGLTLMRNGVCYKFSDKSGTEYRLSFDKTSGELVKYQAKTFEEFLWMLDSCDTGSSISHSNEKYMKVTESVIENLENGKRYFKGLDY